MKQIKEQVISIFFAVFYVVFRGNNMYEATLICGAGINLDISILYQVLNVAVIFHVLYLTVVLSRSLNQV